MKLNWKNFKFSVSLVFFALVPLLIATLLFMKLEFQPPTVSIRGIASSMRSGQTLEIGLSDLKSGLQRIRVTLSQKDQAITLYEKDYPAGSLFFGGKTGEDTVMIPLDPKKNRLTDGPVVLHISVRDHSWTNWLKGNETLQEKTVTIDTTPPGIRVVSPQHNLQQGGAGFVVYGLSESCPQTGVMVGNTFFPGYPADPLAEGSGSQIYLCLFALDHIQGKGTPISLHATDPAGNTAKTEFYHFIKPKQFKKDIIQISDVFLNQKMPEFGKDLSELPGEIPSSPLAQFLRVNQTLRARNTETLLRHAQKSEPTFLWQGDFLRMPNSAPMAGFADHRDYFYNGKMIDQQTHLGVDLASLERSPIPAANSGKVVFTGHVGIYGGTVMIDHGLGLFSVYSHLSRIDAKPDQLVAKGDIIGATGTSGMAGGDHLHFAMIVHNTFVNPLEWWDTSWIQHNVMDKLKLAAGPSAASTSAQSQK